LTAFVSAQGNGLCQIDPSIFPSIAIDRIDLLLDGASATYGSDAIGGVINIILKRNYDGAMTEVGFKTGNGGGISSSPRNCGRTGTAAGQSPTPGTTSIIRPGISTRNSPSTTPPWGLDTATRSVPPCRARSRIGGRHHRM